MKFSYLVLAVSAAAGVYGHIEMTDPAPPKSKYNPNEPESDIDYSYKNPITSLDDFPCKGYHKTGSKVPTGNYSAGQNYSISLEGSATHNGGSCQISLSYDGGETFKVIKSIIGGCPIALKYGFHVPEYAPNGTALLSWSWMNNVGNREFYQNCAWVNIENDDDSATEMKGPDMFAGNLPTYCTVPEGHDFVYPQPGPDVEYGGDESQYTTTCAK